MTAQLQAFRRLLLGAALLAGLFAAPSLYAQGPAGMGDPAQRARTRVVQLTEALKLTPAQVEQVTPIINRQYTGQAAAFQPGQGGDMAARRAAMQKQREKVNGEIAAVLTAGQKAAFQKLLADEDARRAARMQRQ